MTLKFRGFPRVHRQLDLAEFAQYMREQDINEEDAAAVEEALAGNVLNVWLNTDSEFSALWLEYNEAIEAGNKALDAMREGPTPETVAALNACTERAEKLAHECYATLWGCTVEEVEAVYELSTELYRWAGVRSWEMVNEYRDQRKKAARR